MSDDLVSIIIPHRGEIKEHVENTVKSLRDSAVGPVEVCCEEDSIPIGKRALCNRIIERANGKYIMLVDAHSYISPGWDAKMKETCQPKDVVIAYLKTLNTDDWTPTGRGGAVKNMYLDVYLRGHYCNWKTEYPLESLTMTSPGCQIFMFRDRYLELGGYEEKPFAGWGWMGTELSLKVWLSGGRYVTRSDTLCGHMFRGKFPYHVSGHEVHEIKRMIDYKTRNKLWQCQKYPIEWLISQFWPVPTWENGTMNWYEPVPWPPPGYKRIPMYGSHPN